MAEALMNIEKQISMFPLAEQISLMAFLANTIKQKSDNMGKGKALTSRRFGVAKGKLQIPDDIDFCNDEIAGMFGVN